MIEKERPCYCSETGISYIVITSVGTSQHIYIFDMINLSHLLLPCNQILFFLSSTYLIPTYLNKHKPWMWQPSVHPPKPDLHRTDTCPPNVHTPTPPPTNYTICSDPSIPREDTPTPSEHSIQFKSPRWHPIYPVSTYQDGSVLPLRVRQMSQALILPIIQ